MDTEQTAAAAATVSPDRAPGDPGLTLAATFLVFLLVLLVRPRGLFGAKAVR